MDTAIVGGETAMAEPGPMTPFTSFLSRARYSKKCRYVSGFVAVLCIIVVVVIIIVATDKEGDESINPSQVIGGKHVLTSAKPTEPPPSPAATTTPKKMNRAELSAILSSINGVFDDKNSTKAIIKTARMRTMRNALKKAVVGSEEGAKLLTRMGGAAPTSRDVKDMLQELIRTNLEPRTGALTGRSNFGDAEIHEMGPEVIFSRPMDKDDDFFLTRVNKTYRELMEDEEFKERFELFWSQTLGSMDVHHFDTVGRAAGEDLVGDVVSPSIEDMKWLEDINRIVNSYNNLSRSINISDEVFGTEDFNRFQVFWRNEIESQREFGLGQLVNEMREINGVQFNELTPEEDPMEIKRKALKQKLREQQKTAPPDQRMDGDSELGLPVFPARVECDPDVEYQCDDGLSCYYFSEKCDRFVNCADNSDEWNCTCTDYLETYKFCDGFNDCLQGEDEKGCSCPEGRIHCGIKEFSPVCIPEERRCDNIYDCDDGRDEDFCYELGGLDAKMNPKVAENPHSEGLVHVKTAEGWKVVGFDFGPSPKEAVDYYLTELADTVCTDSMTVFSSQPMYELRGPDPDLETVAYLILDLGAVENPKFTQARQGGRYFYKVQAPTNSSQVVAVNCGQPVCGMKSGTRSVEAKVPQTGGARVKVLPALEARIVGGEDSGFANWPFIVAILRDGKFICGGTIVNERWIVSAAHCFDQGANSYHYQVVSGLYRRKSRSPVETVLNIDQIRLHEDYNSTWLSNDIAMARVSTPLLFSYASSPICIPDESICSVSSDIPGPIPGDFCISVGWGQTSEGGKPSDELRQVVIPILDACSKSYNDIRFQVCGGYKEGGKDSCQGDSGGPLFCKNPDRPGAWYLGGVISHGVGCARPGSPGVYTRVCQYRDFIQETIGFLGRIDFDRGKEECPTITCDAGKCVEKLHLCDMRVDCFDGEDENHCVITRDGLRQFFKPIKPASPTLPPSEPVATTEVSTKPAGSIHEMYGVLAPCDPGYFQCKNTYKCIDEKLRCNKKKDCPDLSDEYGCGCRDYLVNSHPWVICDGHPDCPNWEDETGCDYCAKEKASDPNSQWYYCSLSDMCVKTTTMCDTAHDCTMREDERYCLNVISGDQVTYTRDNKPIQYTEGLIAINTRGSWRPLCAASWDKHISDRVCRYTGRRGSISFTRKPQSDYPHLVGNRLSIKKRKPRAKRSLDSKYAPGSLLDVYLHDHHVDPPSFVRSKDNSSVSRMIRQSRTCDFISAKCSPHPTCGVMPLYNFLGQDTPAFGPGVFPWTATLYKDGDYLCGATLVHQDWVLIGEGCATMINPPYDYVVGRLGGYRDQEFTSAHEQHARVVQLTKIPETRVYLGKFDKSVRLSEYVNVICIPDVRWIPKNAKCIITGKHQGVLNQAYETVVTGMCDRQSASNFNLCASKEVDRKECLANWTGALACPDSTGKYYAVGVYYNEGCEAPDKYAPLVTHAVRAGLINVIKTADAGPGPYSGVEDTDCNRKEGKMRCSLGKCLTQDRVCDGYPDCGDLEDEMEDVCNLRLPPVCSPLNSTHCRCPGLDDMLCHNSVCVSTSTYCDGRDDCGDGSDEPQSCSSDCAVGLEMMDRKKICDNRIDCTGFLDLGNDESSQRCCPEGQSYRCMMGKPKMNSNNSHVTFGPKQCLEGKYVCDGNPYRQCASGMDEEDCLSIWPSQLKKKQGGKDRQLPLDPFGRFKSGAEGYLYIVSNGRSFLYCASAMIFTDRLKDMIGQVLCKHEGYDGLISMTLHKPSKIQRADPNTPLPDEEVQHYEGCQLVYIVCAKGDNEM